MNKKLGKKIMLGGVGAPYFLTLSELPGPAPAWGAPAWGQGRGRTARLLAGFGCWLVRASNVRKNSEFWRATPNLEINTVVSQT